MTNFPEPYSRLAPFFADVGAFMYSRWPKINPAPLKIMDKPDGSQVTEIDLAVHEKVKAELAKLFPGDAFLSEEGEGKEEVIGADRLWILDPLDGTSPFIRGDDYFSSLLAHRVNGKIQFCAMVYPAYREIYYAIRGGGAFVNGKRLHVNDQTKIPVGTLYSDQLHSKTKDHWSGEAQYRSIAPTALGIAKGECVAGLIRLSSNGVYIWDYAPFDLFLREAGGRLSDEKDRELDLSKVWIPCEYLSASNGKVQAELQQIISADRKLHATRKG